MRSAFIVTVVLVVSVLVNVAQAATVFDNGPIGSDTGRCDSTPTGCGSQGWTIYDDFSLPSNTVITGFETWNADANVTDYLSTQWSIWNSDPLLGGAPIVSGNATGTASLDLGFVQTSVNGLDVALGAGNYWFGFSQRVSGAYTWTYVSSASGQHNAIQSDSQGFALPGMYDAAFRLYGNVAAPVPEPKSFAMILAGLALVGVRQRLCSSKKDGVRPRRK